MNAKYHNPSICSVSTIKAPRDMVESFVNYHINLGIDHMFLFFDDPEDACLDYFREWSNITAIACTRDHWEGLNVNPQDAIETRQIANALHALSLARNQGLSWFIHIDVDELIYPEIRLSEYLNTLDEDIFAATFKTLEAIPEALEYQNCFSEIRYFREIKPEWRIRKAIAYALGCKNVLKDGYFKGHKLGKTAVRTSADIESIHIHRPTLRNSQKTIISDQVRLLHFDATSYENWYTKWIRRYDGSAKANNLTNTRAELYGRFVETLENSPENLKHLYTREYMIPPRCHSILKALGFIKHIKLENSLFERIH